MIPRSVFAVFIFLCCCLYLMFESDSLLKSSSSSSSQSSRVIKVHLSIGSSVGGHYKSFLITSQDTFGILKQKTLDKIGIKRIDSSFYSLSIHYEYNRPVLHGRGPYHPIESENILKIIEREELFHEGELVFVLNDHRIHSMSKQSLITRMDSSTSPPLSPVILELATEFNQVLMEETELSTIPLTLLDEIESISLKIGRLQIYHSGKDPWRDVIAHLTENAVSYTVISDPHRLLYSIPLQKNVPIAYPEDSAAIFTLPGPIPTLFKAKNRTEMNTWIDTINSRTLLCTENDVIFMAEEFCSVGENRKSCREAELLADSASFEGTLRNSYLRENFRKFLMSTFAQESLLFWEYAEDFRRGHPLSTQPLISTLSPSQSSDQNSSKFNESTQTALRQWAVSIYQCFIADGSPMQVAIPGDAKGVIEKVLNDEDSIITSDLFKHTQNQLFNHLKFQLFPSYVQRPNYRSILMSVLSHIVHQCPQTAQIWSHACLNSSPLLLSSPQTFYPSFFSPRLYSRTHRPYTFLSQGAEDRDTVNSNGENLGRDSSNSQLPEAQARGWGLVGAITRFRVGMKTSTNTPSPTINERPSCYSSSSSGTIPTIKSGSVPTPWREQIIGSPTSLPKWLPQYWWTHVDFKSDTYFTYDESYDTSLLKMLPRWMQAISRRKRTDGLKIRQRKSTNANFSVSSSASTIVDIEQEPFDILPDDQLPYRKLRAETFVNEMLLSTQSDDDLLEYQASGFDVIAHLPPSITKSTINFSSHRGGIAALSKGSTADGVNRGDLSWQCIPVPHLSKSQALYTRLPTFTIPGPIIQCALMSTRYSGVILGSPIVGNSSVPSSPSMDYDREGPISPDSPTPQFSPAALLSTEVERIVVLSSREGGESELRLYDAVTQQLCAIIRLVDVTIIIPSTSLLHVIEIHDVTGSVWYLHPNEIHPNEGTSGAKYWLALLAKYSPNKVRTVLICHEGYLSKRGQFNTALKKRWFVLDSEQKFQYFVRWENGQSRLKGEVAVGTIDDVIVTGRDLKLKTDDRTWFFQADTEDEALFWRVVLTSLIPLKHGIITPPSEFTM